VAGTSAHGQGHETAYTQIACEVLGVDPESVTLHQRDTAIVSQGVGTFGSRSMVMGGSALYLALRQDAMCAFLLLPAAVGLVNFFLGATISTPVFLLYLAPLPDLTA
jgi:hypothetical protein